LKCNGQYPRSIYILAILIIFFKHIKSLTTTLKYFHETLSRSGVDEILHLLMALMNFLFEKRDHVNDSFNKILFKMFILIWQFWATLNIWWRACYRLLISIHGWLLYCKALIASNIVISTSQKTNSNTSNKPQDKYKVEITRKLNKEFLMYCYSIYTIDTWPMLIINNSTLMFMHQP